MERLVTTFKTTATTTVTLTTVTPATDTSDNINGKKTAVTPLSMQYTNGFNTKISMG